MKRMICILMAVLMTAALCACADTVLISTYDGNRVDVNRSDLSELACIGGIDGKDDFTITNEKAWALYDYLHKVCTKETDALDGSGHWVTLLFEAPFNNSSAFLGSYTIYDSGTVSYGKAPYDSTLTMYACDAGVYEKVLELIK